jgi:hypothetical protein
VAESLKSYRARSGSREENGFFFAKPVETTFPSKYDTPEEFEIGLELIRYSQPFFVFTAIDHGYRIKYPI